MPLRTIPIGHVFFERGVHGQISHHLEALTSAHVNVFVIHKAINLSTGAGVVGSLCAGGAGNGVLLEGATEVAEDPILTALP